MSKHPTQGLKIGRYPVLVKLAHGVGRIPGRDSQGSDGHQKEIEI
jgi:hypothetical protein